MTTEPKPETAAPAAEAVEEKAAKAKPARATKTVRAEKPVKAEKPAVKAKPVKAEKPVAKAKPVAAPEVPAPEARAEVTEDKAARKDKKDKKDKKEKKGKKKDKRKKEAVIIRFDDEQIPQVDARAEALGLSRAAWVRMVVAQALAKS